MLTRAAARTLSLQAGERAIARMQESYGARLLEELRRPLDAVLPADSTLLQMSEYQLSTGGKRLRAFLPLLTAERLGSDPERLLPFGAACEIVHNATLVHDDVQDGDRFRRGHETVWQRFGIPRAINLGDALFYQAVLLCQRLNFGLEVREAIVRRLLSSTLQTIDGQEREFALMREERPRVEDYFRMVECKTSGLFALPMAGAAALCEAPADVVAGLEEAARHLGVLFQIQDDLLDLFGDKGREHVARDIGEGKRSALVVYALEVAGMADAQRLSQLLGAGAEAVDEEALAWVKDLFVRTSALQRACTEIFRRHGLALESLELFSAPRLRELIDEMAHVFVSPIRHVVSAVEGMA